jgi:hypothetical protein
MTGDRTMTDPESGKAQPADESRAKPPMDELSRRLGSGWLGNGRPIQGLPQRRGAPLCRRTTRRVSAG